MSVYDPNVLAQMTFVGANSTETTPHPTGDHPVLIKEAKLEAWEKQDKSSGGVKCTLLMESLDPEGKVKAITGREKNNLRFEFFLDLTPEGGLDMGKGMNVRLGRAREACGINDATRPFAFDQFIGQTPMASVSHETYKNQLQARVDALAKA